MAPRKLKRNKRSSSRHYYRHSHQDSYTDKSNNNTPMLLNSDGLIKNIDMRLIGNSSSSSSRDGESLPFYDMQSHVESSPHNQNPTGNEVEHNETEEEPDSPRRKSLRKGKAKSKSKAKRNPKRGGRTSREETEQKELDKVSGEGQGNNNDKQIDFEIVNLPHCSHVCVDGKCAIVRPSRRSSRKGKSHKKARSKSKRSYKRVSRSQNRNTRSKRK